MITSFLDLIRDKSMQWWQKKLADDNFDLLYQNFSFRSFNSVHNARRDFTLSVLIDKIQAYGLALQEREGQCVFEAHLESYAGGKGYLNKSDLRRFLIFMEFPLTRRECKILYHMLDLT
jgi:hypothetical protein